MPYHNPYFGQSFLGVFITLAARVWGFLNGSLPLEEIAADEIQILVLVNVAVSAALVGCFLVLRKTTMLANSLSHTILIGIVAAFLLTSDGVLEHSAGGLNIQAMLLAAVIMGIATAFLTEFLTNITRLQEDASMGLVFTSLFALGIVLVTALTRNAHIGTEVVMGNVDALKLEDFKLVFVILIMNLVLFTLFFKEYKITTFDPAFARAMGFSTVSLNYLLMVQMSATAIGAFRAVGVLMVLAFITAPVLTARLLTNDLKKLLFLSAAIGCAASFIGVALARHCLSVYDMALSTGGIVVCVLTVCYLLALIKTNLQE